MKRVKENNWVKGDRKFGNLMWVLEWHQFIKRQWIENKTYNSSLGPLQILDEKHEKAIQEIKNNFTESYREMIERVIRLLDENSQISEINGECLNTACLMKNELSKHPKISPPKIGDQEDSDRLKSLEMVIDGIKQKSWKEKKTKFYHYLGQWENFLNDNCTLKAFDIYLQGKRPKDLIYPQRITDLFSQLDPGRREKIRDKIQNWERQNATRI